MLCTSLMMLSIAVSKSLYDSGSRWPVQYYARTVCGRAEQRSPSPRSCCFFLGALLSHHAAAWTSSLKTWLNLCFSCQLRSLQLNSSVAFPQRESNKRTACSLTSPSALRVNALTSLWKRGNSISVLLPSPAERCSFFRQGLPLASTTFVHRHRDLCVTPITAVYHLVYL